MKVNVTKGWGRSLLLLAPLALILALFFAFSGPFQAAAHDNYVVSNDPNPEGCWGQDSQGVNRNNLVSPFGVYEYTDANGEVHRHDYWDDPNSCHAAPWGVNDNPFADALGIDATDEPIDDVLDAPQVQQMLKMGDPANPANPGKKVHIIDVRVAEEQFDGTAPCLLSIGAVPFPIANSGHPIWKDAVTGEWAESYHVPMFVGFYWNGTNRDQGIWQYNIRPEPNPNFVALGYQDEGGTPNNPTPDDPNDDRTITMNNYFNALKEQGEIADGDTFVFMCQTGWRAAYASAIFKNLPGFENSRVYNMYGGMRGWTGTTDPASVWSGDITDPVVDGGYVTDKAAYDGDGECRPFDHLDANNNPVMGAPGPCDQDKRLRTLPGNATNSTDGYNYLHGTATDPNVTDRFAYNVTRIAKAGGLVMWNGTEQHVQVKPEWHTGFGSGDFNLSVTGNNARWVGSGKLAVDYLIQNQTAEYNQIVEYPAGSGNYVRNVPRLNYYDECGGAPVEEGGECDSVMPAPWAPAYNVQAIKAKTYSTGETIGTKADNGVTVDSVSSPCAPGNPIGGYCAPIAPGGAGVVTVTYNVPAGVTSFTSNPVVTATDIPDDKRSFFGASFDWFFTYTYSHWTSQVTVPPAPTLGVGGL